MEPEFRFCLNGEVSRSIRVQHEMIDERLLELAAWLPEFAERINRIHECL